MLLGVFGVVIASLLIGFVVPRLFRANIFALAIIAVMCFVVFTN
ncbi:MAG: hypothetical protein ACRCWB_11920 [Enterovibrio sp.]